MSDTEMEAGAAAVGGVPGGVTGVWMEAGRWGWTCGICGATMEEPLATTRDAARESFKVHRKGHQSSSTDGGNMTSATKAGKGKRKVAARGGVRKVRRVEASPMTGTQATEVLEALRGGETVASVLKRLHLAGSTALAEALGPHAKKAEYRAAVVTGMAARGKRGGKGGKRKGE